jgi:histidinol-phosphate aminotransferase
MPKPISRRRFAGLLGGGAALASLSGLQSALALAPRRDQAAAANPSPVATGAIGTGGIVRLSSNENPYGPSPAALKALEAALPLAWRYPDDELDGLAEDVAKEHGVEPDQLLFGPGSSEILRLCAASSTGPNRPLVMADPTFEALGRGARAAGAEIVKVPLTADFRHDLTKMLAARNPAGLIYLCNPNNPTASLTPKEEVSEFLTKVPATTTVLVDEAYFHFADSPRYESVLPLVQKYENLIVARTFSKIHGLAGMRCGYAVAQPRTIERLAAHQAWDNVSLAAIATARAARADSSHVARCRLLLAEAKGKTVTALEAMGFPVIPSQANFFMADLKREVRPVIAGLKARGVLVGRVFPALPNHLRVTVGTAGQMERFLAELRTVLG